MMIGLGKRIGIIRIKAIDLRITEERDLTFRLDILDTKSGSIISSEEMLSSSDLKERIADRKIKDFLLDLPMEILSFRILTLPFSDKKRLKEVIPFELQRLIIEDIGEIVFDTLCLGKEGDLFKIVVVYISKDRFGRILGILSNCGVDPFIATSISLRDLLKEGGQEALSEKLIKSITTPSEALPHLWMEEVRSPTINLRIGPFIFKRGTERFSKNIRILTYLLIAIAIVINLDLTIRIVEYRKDISLMKEGIKRSYSRLFPSERRVTDEVYQLKAHLKEVKERIELVRGVSPLDFLLNLSKMMLRGVVINEIGLTTEGLTLKGEATSMEEINKLKGVSEIELNLSDLKPLSDGRFYFTLSGSIRR